MREDTYPKKQRDYRVAGSDTDQMIRDKELKQHAEDWDFDPKFRHGSISEETPDEKRRSVFYAVNRHAIENMTSSLLHLEYSFTGSIDRAALVVSEIAKRAGEAHYLKQGDPEWGDSTSCDIDEL
jgi:hypothetical protein